MERQLKNENGLWAEILACPVRAGTIVLWWIHQAGIVLKTPGGSIAAVDAYLSRSRAAPGQVPQRSAPVLLDPWEVEVSVLLASHSHEDHLDPDSLAGLLRGSSARFVGPPTTVSRVVASGFPVSRATALVRGDITHVGDLTIRAVHARHLYVPEPTPDAIGYVFEVEGVSLYHSGDTEYDAEILNDTRGVTASMISINGTTGNMNAHEAALLAWQQGARVAMPFHYGLWREGDYGAGATVDPRLFVDTYQRLGPVGTAMIFEPGAAVVLDQSGLVA